MAKNPLHLIAKQIVANHKGLLAADESEKTATKRLASINMESTPETRRQYRDLFLTAAGIEEGISGVILHHETMEQSASNGTPFVKLLQQKGIIPGIKVDAGTADLPNFPGEKVTEGLDKLAERFKKYYEAGARFSKWRAVITIGEGIPTDFCILANAHALARYAALSQAAGLVPVVEPEVLIDGTHDLARSEEVTTKTLQIVFKQLKAHKVDLKGTILKSSMVISGKECPTQASPEEIGQATIRCFTKAVPKRLAGIVFLSGGQKAVQATENLNAVVKANPGTWPISFSYARALQGPPLQVWQGKPENVPAAQKEFIKRLKANVAANAGKYTPEMEQ
ncbi:MAG: fructose-bisphosphate aldolase class I [Patescibacteria group bacterium]|nr:fructose-bisphosphate aldolase class I [Patescibacteria group bacterium]MDD5715397.1 fructose-bisphosphate aldolase class I [Patescibacteria group bacterium]